MNAHPDRPSIAFVTGVFLRLGVIGFGGPAAHIALMQEELVERRGWLSKDAFGSMLGVTNLIPGPNSSEMAIHAGYVVAGPLGGLAAGIAFVLPAFVLMLGLSVLYFHTGGFSVRADVFAGLQPVVIAAIVATAWRLRTTVRGAFAVALAAAVLVLTVALPTFEAVWLLLAGGAGLAFWTRGSRTADRPGAVVAALGAKRVAPILVGVAAAGGLPVLAWVFLKTGLLMFGGGYVLIPLLQPEVLARHWLTKAQFLDGIALGQATPGPITTSSAFIGYAVAGFPGAVVATVAVYLPAFVAVLGGTGPFLRSFQHRPAVAAFVRGVTAGALGAILGAAILLAPAGLNTVLKIVIGVVAGVALFRRVPIWAVLPAAALVSVLVSLVR